MEGNPGHPDTFWQVPLALDFASEAEVETRLVQPLLLALGYNSSDIDPKVRVEFREGKRGRPHEADFVAYSEAPHDASTALLVVEVKAPSQQLGPAKAQAESYAQNLKAPIYILTNGTQIEIWQTQISRESNLILALEVAQLGERKADIERVVSKQSAIDYSVSLLARPLNALETSWEGYLSALRIGLKDRTPFVHRILSVASGGEINSAEIIAAYPQGAILAGPSGYGKTSLAARLVEMSLATQPSLDERLPLEIFLPDLATCGAKLEDFIVERLQSHVPSVTPAIVKDQCRGYGLRLICDGFDRVPVVDRSRIETGLRLILKDFPKTQLFVASSPDATPALGGLETLKLEKLTEDDQIAILNFFEPQTGAPAILLWPSLSKLMVTLCESPVVLSLAISAYVSVGRFPNNLEELFASWVEAIVGGEHSSLRRVELVETLSLVAVATSDGPIGADRIRSMVQVQNIPTDRFETLLDRGAIIRHGLSFELAHEAIADYFRAKAILDGPLSELEQKLSKVALSANTLLPVLLMALAKAHEVQQMVWERVVSIGISEACSAVRYRAPTDLEGLAPDEVSQRFLLDLISAVEDPLKIHFPALANGVFRRLTGQPAEHLRVIGSVAQNHSDACYSIQPREINNPARVQIQPAVDMDYSNIRIHNLRLQELRPDSGRLFGLEMLRLEIERTLKGRKLLGGPIWHEELILSRIRVVQASRRIKWAWGDDLRVLRDFLNDNRTYSYGSSSGTGEWFRAEQLLADIQPLLDAGKRTVLPWWRSLPGDQLAADEVKSVICSNYNAFFHRGQIALKEVQEVSFPGLPFPELELFPARYQISVTSNGSNRPTDWLVAMKVRPVAEISQAGADVSFPRDQPQFDRDNDIKFIRDEFLTARNKLPLSSHFRWHFSRLNDFDKSIPWSNCAHDETAVIGFVCMELSNSLMSLFDELPKMKRDRR